MKIAKLRKKLNLTQQMLAEVCDTSQQQIAKLERGIVDPRLSTIRKLARAFNVSVSEMFYSREEFLFDINSVIKEEKLNLKNISLYALNEHCLQKKQIPSFHPWWEEIQTWWEEIQIKKNKVQFIKE